MLLTLSAENSWHLYFFMIRILVTDPCLKVLYITAKDKSSRLHITPPLLSLSGYGSKSPVKCCVVIPLLSLLWSIYRLPPPPPPPPPPFLLHSKQKRPHMTTKEKVICEMSWLCGLCNIEQFAWLLPIDSASQLKPQPSEIHCVVLQGQRRGVISPMRSWASLPPKIKPSGCS